MEAFLKLSFLIFSSSIIFVVSEPAQDFQTAILNGFGQIKEVFDQGAAVKQSGQHEIGFGPAVIKTSHKGAVGFGDAMKSGSDDSSEESDEKAESEKISRKKRAPCWGKGRSTENPSDVDGEGTVEQLRQARQQGMTQMNRNRRTRRDAEFHEQTDEVNQNQIEDNMRSLAQRFREAWNQTLDAMKGMMDSLKSRVSKIGKDSNTSNLDDM